MNRKRVMIAAPKSGSGKTTIACALLLALKKQGYQAVSCKCGPDYIDPMFHEKVIGIPSKNLDTFFTGEEQTRELFLNHVKEKDFAVLEGVMGLFDGLGGVREEGSSYHLAKVTKTPIIFAADAKGMGRSLISLIAGFLNYDKEHLIRGVLLNRISKGYYETIKPLIEEELKIPVIGFLPEQKEIHMESRHLGLVLPDEIGDIRAKLEAVSEKFLETVSMEDIVKIAGNAETIEMPLGYPFLSKRQDHNKEKPVIAVARDEAFCFYYADNIHMLEEYGAEIAYFSPLYDEKLPDKCHGLLIGGGYPELYAEQLSKNRKMRMAVYHAVQGGMPTVAECGGFMYLHSAIIDRNGTRWDMAGVLPADCYDTGKLVRFGYIEISEKRSCFLPKGEMIKGHEFHYYDSMNNGTDAVARKPMTGREYPCILEGKNYWLGFPHLYYPSNPAFAESFVEKTKMFPDNLAFLETNIK